MFTVHVATENETFFRMQLAKEYNLTGIDQWRFRQTRRFTDRSIRMKMCFFSSYGIGRVGPIGLGSQSVSRQKNPWSFVAQ